MQHSPELETGLRNLDEVAECAVVRRDCATGWWTVGYVVPAADVPLAVVRERAVDRLCRLVDPARVAVVLVRRIPREPAGRPNLAALSAVPVLTDDTLNRMSTVDIKMTREPVTAVPGTVRLADRDAPLAAGPKDAVRLEARDSLGPPAEVGGGPLEVAPQVPSTLVEAIRVAAARRLEPGQPPLGVRLVARDGDTFFGYDELLERGRAVVGGLRRRGLAPEDRAILLVPQLPEYVQAVWGCLLAGVRYVTVPCPARFDQPDPLLDKLLHVWRSLGRPLVVTDAATASSLMGLGSRYGEPEFAVATVAELADGELGEIYESGPTDVAILALSAGSTGQSKVIQVTHRAVVENALGLRAIGMVAPGETAFNWLPFDHVAPQVMCLFRDLVLGLQSVHAPTSYIVEQPLRWLDVLDRLRVNHSWSPNFGYRMVADALGTNEGRWDLSCVRTLFNAGEQCTASVIRDFLAGTARYGIRPEGFINGWGMAETATAAVCKYVAESGAVRRFLKSTLDSQLREAGPNTAPANCVEFVSMGAPVPGARVRVVNDAGRVLPERVVGRLQARGTRVTPGYLDAAANQAAFTPDGWFDTGDLAFIVDGELVVAGRAKELIVLNGDKYYCHEIEEVCRGLPGVRDGLVAACGVPDGRTGTEALAVFFVPDPAAKHSTVETARAVRRAVLSRLHLVAGLAVPIGLAEFPRTTSGKIQRAALVQRYQAGDFDQLLRELEATGTGADEVPACVFVEGWQAVEQPAGRADAAPAGGYGTGPGACGAVVPADDVLVFADELGLAEAVWPQGTAVTVRPGRGFRRVADGYIIDPARPGHWAALRDDLARHGRSPRSVVYLWSYLSTPDPFGEQPAVHAAVARCGQYLISCIKTFERAALVTVSRQLHQVTGDERVCYPAAPAAVITTTLARERSGVPACHLDLPGADREQDAALLHGALPDVWGGPHGAASEQVWRAGRRYVRTLVPVPPPDATEPGRDALVRGGGYLVAGGAGGVAGELLAGLVERYGVRLLVLGRRQAAGPDAGPGAAVRYHRADVTDARAVARAVEAAERDWGRPLSGVLHLADEYRLRLLERERPGDWRPDRLAKVAGTLNLLALLRERPGARLVIFSSVLGTLPFGGCAAYGAGNAFADALVRHQADTVPVQSLAWGLWHGLGMSRNNPYETAVNRRGVLSLTAEQGQLLTRFALRQPAGVYYVGLDGTAAELRGVVSTVDNLALECAVVQRVAGHDGGVLSAGTDPFGVPVPVAEPSPERVADGHPGPANVVLERMRKVLAGFLGAGTDPALLGAERQLAEFGVNSVGLLRLHAHLEAALDREIPKSALFDYPTVGALADYLADRSA
ncbi:MAG: AMP-binding protein [Micromonosporaceae bacterium]|nr:AMP-binding protein [Micromonosporaceae bacterium]